MRPQELLASLRDLLLGGDTRALLTVLVVVLLVVYVIGIIVYIASARSSRARLSSMLEDRAASATQSSGRWVLRIAIPLLLIGAVFASDAYLSRPSTCATCHREGDHQASLAQSPHASVECMQCHSPSGPGALLRRQTTYARWLAVYGVTKQSPKPLPGSVDSGSCLRCHEEIEQGVVMRNGIRVRHSDILEAGGVCGDCHNGTAHPSEDRRSTEPSMDQCVTCHDGVAASNECSMCHVADVAFTPATERGYSPSKITDTWDSCYRCHAEKPCTSCHGIKMPHPPGWSPNEPGGGGLGHAKPGFASREVCWRCHYVEGREFQPSDEACSCHGLKGDFHGGEAWVTEHALEATGKRGGANAACFDCHSQNLCAECHPESYNSLYAPNLAAPPTPGYAPSPTQPEDIF